MSYSTVLPELISPSEKNEAFGLIGTTIEQIGSHKFHGPYSPFQMGFIKEFGKGQAGFQSDTGAPSLMRSTLRSLAHLTIDQTTDLFNRKDYISGLSHGKLAWQEVHFPGLVRLKEGLSVLREDQHV